MRRLLTALSMVVALGLVVMRPEPGWATPPVGCCIEQCANPAWTSCAGGTCTGGNCLPPGSDISASTSPCSEVEACPKSEAGQCADGVNNDAYQNDLTDCRDPACFSDPACRPTAPAISQSGLAVTAVLLAAGGIAVLRRRRRGNL
jgi:hypothetical protein